MIITLMSSPSVSSGLPLVVWLVVDTGLSEVSIDPLQSSS